MNRRRRLLARQSAGGPAFDPVTLNPLIWFDFSDIATLFQDAARTTPITTDGQIIQGVADKSSSGWHIGTGTATYKTNIQNGKSAVLFDGAADYLRTASVTHGIGTGDFYLAVVDRRLP